jgi:hypothetical protein
MITVPWSFKGAKAANSDGGKPVEKIVEAIIMLRHTLWVFLDAAIFPQQKIFAIDVRRREGVT